MHHLPFSIPHQLIDPKRLNITEASVLSEDTTLTPMAFIMLTTLARGMVLDQNRDALATASMGITSKYGSYPLHARNIRFKLSGDYKEGHASFLPRDVQTSPHS